jgi:hypothetical protein
LCAGGLAGGRARLGLEEADGAERAGVGVARRGERGLAEAGGTGGAVLEDVGAADPEAGALDALAAAAVGGRHDVAHAGGGAGLAGHGGGVLGAAAADAGVLEAAGLADGAR